MLMTSAAALQSITQRLQIFCPGNQPLGRYATASAVVQHCRCFISGHRERMRCMAACQPSVAL